MAGLDRHLSGDTYVMSDPDRRALHEAEDLARKLRERVETLRG